MSRTVRLALGAVLSLASVPLWLGCSAHAASAVPPASPTARAVVAPPEPTQPTPPTMASANALPPPPASTAPAAQPDGPPTAAAQAAESATAPDGAPPGVQTFAGFRPLTAAELDADFGEYTVHPKPDAPPEVVASCRALLRLPFSAEIELESFNENEDRSFWFSVMDCAAWSMVQSARPASHTHLDALFSAKDPTRLLPPLLGLTDFMEVRSKVEAAATGCRSWKAFDPSLRVRRGTADGFEVQAAGWRGEVRYIARADFDGDGVEDLLLRRDAEAEGGSFRASALFLLSQTDQDRCLRVTLVLGQS